jgi:hypothetical protein
MGSAASRLFLAVFRAGAAERRTPPRCLHPRAIGVCGSARPLLEGFDSGRPCSGRSVRHRCRIANMSRLLCKSIASATVRGPAVGPNVDRRRSYCRTGRAPATLAGPFAQNGIDAVAPDSRGRAIRGRRRCRGGEAPRRGRAGHGPARIEVRARQPDRGLIDPTAAGRQEALVPRGTRGAGPNSAGCSHSSREM